MIDLLISFSVGLVVFVVPVFIWVLFCPFSLIFMQVLLMWRRFAISLHVQHPFNQKRGSVLTTMATAESMHSMKNCIHGDQEAFAQLIHATLLSVQLAKMSFMSDGFIRKSRAEPVTFHDVSMLSYSVAYISGLACSSERGHPSRSSRIQHFKSEINN